MESERVFTWYRSKEVNSIFFNVKTKKLYNAHKDVLRDHYPVFFQIGKPSSQLYSNSNMVRVARVFKPEKKIAWIPRDAIES